MTCCGRKCIFIFIWNVYLEREREYQARLRTIPEYNSNLGAAVKMFKKCAASQVSTKQVHKVSGSDVVIPYKQYNISPRSSLVVRVFWLPDEMYRVHPQYLQPQHTLFCISTPRRRSGSVAVFTAWICSALWSFFILVISNCPFLAEW